MEQLKDIGAGERCFILCNGPSLNSVDLEAISHQGATFGMNRIYLKGFTPDYYVCTNDLVLEQFGEEIAEIDAVKFFPTRYEQVVPQKGQVYDIDTSGRFPRFSEHPNTDQIWEGHTVTFVALQLAYYMGFKEIIILGADHDFGQLLGQPNQERTQQTYDAAHFDPNYFGPGIRWNLPDLARSELAFSLANTALVKAGRRVYNASSKTKLKVFPVAPLNYLLDGGHHRVTAVVSAYKAEEFMEGLLEDIKLQTEEGLEIVVVCQDGSVEHRIAADSKLKHLRIVATKDVPTIYKAWNIGIEHASGKYITNWNTDDRRHPDACRLMADVLDGMSHVDLVYADTYITWEAGHTFAEFESAWDGQILEAGRAEGRPGVFVWADYASGLLADGCFIGPMPMWRANLHQRFGMFQEHLKSAGDYDFWLRIAGDDNVFHINELLGLYMARLDGVELADLELNARESQDALILNQERDGVEVRSVGVDLIRIRMGGKYGYISADDTRMLLGRLVGA